ncbi:hypothetical protein BH09VER1_BH09VER1_28790 [soil metagenome]
MSKGLPFWMRKRRPNNKPKQLLFGQELFRPQRITVRYELDAVPRNFPKPQPTKK